jgi:hypothetical protein
VWSSSLDSCLPHTFWATSPSLCLYTVWIYHHGGYLSWETTRSNCFNLLGYQELSKRPQVGAGNHMSYLTSSQHRAREATPCSCVVCTSPPWPGQQWIRYFLKGPPVQVLAASLCRHTASLLQRCSLSEKGGRCRWKEGPGKTTYEKSCGRKGQRPSIKD